MAKKLQILRGTTAQNDAYTGSIGELTMDTEKVEVRIHDGTTQGGKTIGSDLVLVGIVAPFAGTTAPTGWLKCDGSAISRTTYADLFAAIGTTYGAGDGSTTFNLPNLTGRVPLGMDASYVGQSTNGVLPNITATWHTVSASGTARQPVVYNGTGAVYTNDSTYIESSYALSATNSYRCYHEQGFNASRSNSMYGNGWFSGERVVPSSVGMTYCIKY